jgi:hypothetical protein
MTTLTSIPDKEVMEVMIGIWIFGLKCKHSSVRRCVKLDNCLHGQRTIDEVRWLIVHIFHLDNYALVVSV